MDPFECYTFDKAINNETIFKRSLPQGYSKITKNIQRQGKQIPKSKLESKMAPTKTDQVSEPPNGVKDSLKSMMLHGTEEEKLGDVTK